MQRRSRLASAVRAIYEETAEFRFKYPVMIVPEAGPKESLHYYLYKYSNKTPMRTDANGIPLSWNRVIGLYYSPGLIAMCALGNLGDFLRSGDQSYLDLFLNEVNWLEKRAVIRADKAIVWPNTFDTQIGPIAVKAPWISCNVQGLVISCLVRGWRITRRPGLVELLKGCYRVFQIDSRSNGFCVHTEGHVVYSEVPSLPAPGIMDGFMRSLLALYDLYVETADPEIYQLFQQGVEGLKHFIDRWDYRKKWSWYSNGAYLCPPSYHRLNCLMLKVLSRLTSESCFAKYAEAWDPDRLSALGRAEIYLGFLFTKNACRVKHRTWRQKNSSEPRRAPVIAANMETGSTFGP